MLIKDAIKEYRKKNKITLRDLSSKTGISYSQLSKIERGESRPSNDTLTKIIDSLEIDLKILDLDDYFDEISLNELSLKRRKYSLIRFKVLNRDHFTCQLCGTSAPSVPVEIESIIPHKNSWEDADFDNLITLCANCHTARHIQLGQDSLENDYLYKKYKKK